MFAEDQKTQRFVEEYSSQIRAQKREKTMRMFQEGSIWLLISSDTIARGVDIPDIDVVVNYDLPFYTESYIHRAGRTARASECSERLWCVVKEGEVVSLVKPEQEGFFSAITQKIQGSRPMKLEEEEDGVGLQERYIEALGEMKTIMTKKKTKKERA